MAKTVTFTDDEASFVRDVCSAWLEMLPDTKQDTIEDPLINTPEMLLDLVDGVEKQARLCNNILEKMGDGDQRTDAA